MEVLKVSQGYKGGMTIYQSALDVIIYNDNFYNISDNRLSNGYN